MNPAAFIGRPDWRSAALAMLFALPWLLLLGGRRLRRPWIWLAVVLGAALFPFSIAWVQVPIQRGISALWTQLLPSSALQKYLLLVGLPSVVVSGLVQESVKFGVAVAVMALLGARRDARAGIAAGAAAGTGFGGFEAFWVFNQIFGMGFTWATVQLAGVGALLGFIERLSTVPFHIGAAALAGYGYATRRPWRFLLLAIGLHTLSNYGVLVLGAGLIDITGVEAWAVVVAAATIGSALWLSRRARRAVGPSIDSMPQGPASASAG